MLVRTLLHFYDRTSMNLKTNFAGFSRLQLVHDVHDHYAGDAAAGVQDLAERILHSTKSQIFSRWFSVKLRLKMVNVLVKDSTTRLVNCKVFVIGCVYLKV